MLVLHFRQLEVFEQIIFMKLRTHLDSCIILYFWIRKLSAVINGTASRHVLDRSLKLVDLLNSAQRNRYLLLPPNDLDECVDDLDIEFMTHDCFHL